jgi:hypothetical protein
MAKSKNDVNIHFEGETDGLVIKLNGKIIFPYQKEKIIKEINPNKLKTQLIAGVAAVFSGAVNRIMPLRQTWKRWPVKSRVPYRNILAANIKRCTSEHPTTESMICPDSGLSLPQAQSLISAQEIKIDVQTFNGVIELDEKENMLTIVGILSVYSPREKEYDSCTIYPLSAEVKDFMPTQNIGATFSINDDMAAIISNYEKCILFYTIIIGQNGGMTRRWFKANYQEYLLSIDAEGKFTGGERINQDN